MACTIRPFRPEDAPALNALTLAAIRGIGPRSYSRAQVDAWAARHSPPGRFVERARNGAAIFVAADESDVPVAYALLEEAGDRRGHLDMLYCRPDHARTGLAGSLLEHAERHARIKGMSALFTEASELARAAFERAGYRIIGRRDFAIEHEGRPVPIHNYAMEKNLR